MTKWRENLMKKSLLALMLAIALVSLTACGSKVKEPEATATPVVTEAPTAEPTEEPTAEPTEAPTAEPTEEPTAEPTEAPTAEPTEAPTAEPTEAPTAEPTAVPTEAPTAEPTEVPTAEPTEAPTAVPTEAPTAVPTEAPTAEPTAVPTEAPTAVPTEAPTEAPTAVPTEAPAATEEPAAEEAALTLSDDVLASAYNGAVTVLKSEIQDEYDQMLSQYVAYYAQYGYSVDEYDTELQASVAQETVQTKLSTSIVHHYAAQNGYELTEEKKTELAAQVKTALDNTREYLESYLSASGFTGDELNAAVEEQMAQAGYTEETLMDSAELNDVLNFLYERATADVTVTEDEVKAAFDEKVAKQKESYASVDAFVNDYVNESDILYTPENVRLMECIFVASVEGEATEDEATADEATADEATADEATVSEATAGEAADIASLTGYAKAKAIAAAIAGGADFEETMKAYTEDGSTEEQMLRGYPVAENSTTYGEAFMAGAMALEHVGDVSDVIVTDYGYFILRYAKDLESGEADFEARKETETEETLTNKKNDAYSAFIDTILDEADIQVGDLSQMYHVYVGEAVEATVAYASVNADAKLLDMPGGDAVADMKAGASVDILGSIDADGKTYSFVAVPGTEIKGYVGADMLDEMAEDAALAVDNAALVTRVEQIDKNPTFTIAMNDGSLIYGELYPEKAPESVGNFVSLANGSFYDGLTFHRVISGFMIQGGDPNGDGTGGPGYAIRGEFSSNGVENDLSHVRGVLSMARSSANDSAGSQFFIMHADSDYLDGNYAAFGMVLGGLDTVDVIASVPTDSNDKPRTEQVMRTVYVETYGKTYTFTKLED